ncbi:MAG: undecaprenyldiphospho-muramoylpentapeptide beta-N-acetylglucosaminyltransferase [Acidobacteriota bacterium]|nr:undecaprenyldiphospho-muramoylpentapeptide beta-N-acetylglucosaminyltransferase [Acidobacteriota bacterium]
MRAVLAGGGTGGHVIPALAIAHELRARYGAEVAFIGTERGIETRLVPKAGFALHFIEVGGLKNVSMAQRMKTLLALPRAVVRSWQILQAFKPQVVIGVGGYASGPAMLAASLSSIPNIAFEPNVVPGLANRVVAPLVTTAVVQFEQTGEYFRRYVVTGVPVRHAFFELPPRPPAERTPGERPTLLVFGGSQGAAAINRAVIEALPELAARVPGLHIIHQTGERDYNPAQAAYLRAPLSAEVSAFIDDMPQAYARADVLLCRAGASTVAEITAAGKPAIFVPFPRASDDHQLRNAETLAARGAAMLIPEAELTRERLIEAVAGLLNDAAARQRMSAAARAMAHADAAGTIAAIAARLAGAVRNEGNNSRTAAAH